jgi:F0F1-type ATP synthase assembly protein I
MGPDLQKRAPVLLTLPKGHAYTVTPMTDRDQRQDSWTGMGTGWSITSTMIGGIATLGVLGYLVDRLLGIGDVFLPIGFVLGGGFGVYIIWLRYGRGEGDGS